MPPTRSILRSRVVVGVLSTRLQEREKETEGPRGGESVLKDVMLAVPEAGGGERGGPWPCANGSAVKQRAAR